MSAAPSRNAPCPCGSGKKFKHCCLRQEAARNPVGGGADQYVQSAFEQHQAGRLQQAEVGYRQALLREPNHPDALYLLGVLNHQLGRGEAALELIQRAIRANPDHPYYHDYLGTVYKTLHRLSEAEAGYRRALALKPDLVEAHYNLGVVLQDQGKLSEAERSYRQALAYRPDFVEAHYNLGIVLKDQDRPGEAEASFLRTLEFKPDHAEAHNNLGNVRREQGRFAEAEASYRRALALKPDHAGAHNNLGAALQALGRLDEAMASHRRALALEPGLAEAHSNLGNALKDQGRPSEAEASYLRALELKPDYAEAYNNLGNARRDQGRLAEAEASYRQALAIEPDYAEAHNNLGATLLEFGRIDEAMASYRRALALKPDFAEAHCNLGNALMDLGHANEAAASYRRALEHKIDFGIAYSNLLFACSYHVLTGPQEYLVEARGWERACVPEAERQAARNRTFERSPLPGRRLKLGYVSGDYRQHPVSYNIEQLFACHDRGRVELYAYSTNGQRDAVTERVQALAEHWVPVVGMSDAALRDRIEADGIDVLVDLSGHTARNRLGVFARRAAPVQVYYLGYFASTGLSEMDYLIGDAILTPPATDSHFSERVWRLPRIWECYNNQTDAPAPGWRPAEDGSIWLGSFNNLGKLTPATLALWAEVLGALPQAKLLLKTKELSDAGNRERILSAMRGHGVAPERIELRDTSATPQWSAHMAYYDRLDLALDPVGGMSGGNTSCEALWMGAPLVTLAGDRMSSRITATIVDALGHPEWIARSEDEYIAKAVALARDVALRRALRAGQREQMAASPLCDARGLAQCLESAYSEMFARWVGGKDRQNLRGEAK